MKKTFIAVLTFICAFFILGDHPLTVYASSKPARQGIAPAYWLVAQTTLQATPTGPLPTAVPTEPLVTSTPNSDGSIIQVVGNGQTLWGIAIAYGVKIADILKNSNLPANTNTVYVGEKLVIKPASPATETPTLTATLPTATSTRFPTHTPRAPTPSPTRAASPTITPTPTPEPWYARVAPQIYGNQRTIGMVLVSICVIGLIIVGLTGFRRK